MDVKYSPPENHYITLDIEFATAYGVNQALLFAKLHRLINEWNGYTDDNGNKWVRLTHEEWEAELPFLKNMTIRRTIEDCEEKGLILSTVFERRSKWYRCNPDFIQHNVSVQNEQIQQEDNKYLCKMNTSYVQNEQLPKSLPNSIDITTTTPQLLSKYFSEKTGKQPRGIIDSQTWDDDCQDILDKANGDVTRAKGLIDESIAILIELGYPRNKPAGLLVTIDNLLKPKPQRNGASKNGHSAGNKQTNAKTYRTGADLAEEPYYDPATNEHVFPDGHREPVGI